MDITILRAGGGAQGWGTGLRGWEAPASVPVAVRRTAVGNGAVLGAAARATGRDAGVPEDGAEQRELRCTGPWSATASREGQTVSPAASVAASASVRSAPASTTHEGADGSGTCSRQPVRASARGGEIVACSDGDVANRLDRQVVRRDARREMALRREAISMSLSIEVTDDV